MNQELEEDVSAYETAVGGDDTWMADATFHRRFRAIRSEPVVQKRLEYARHKSGSVRGGRQPQQQVVKGGARKRHGPKLGHVGTLCGCIANAGYPVAVL
jgi:hypothetical protein